jgi:NAD+ synthase (glutamine-hydrolysing)
MYKKGFIKVSAATPEIQVGNIEFNKTSILNLLDKCNSSIVVFPELCITGYSSSDLFYQGNFLSEALDALYFIISKTKYKGIYILGVPLDLNGALYNCAVVIKELKILGVVPKMYIPNHHEFYEKRWFHSGLDTNMKKINILDQNVSFGSIIFEDTKNVIRFGVEICQDLWATYSPSDDMSLAGANMIFNLSASSEHVMKNDIRKICVLDHSRKQMGAYIYTSSGVFESTSEVCYSSHQLIAVQGELIEEYIDFSMKRNILTADIDLEGINFLKRQDSTFRDLHFKHIKEYQIVNFDNEESTEYIFDKELNKFPFIPESKKEEAIFQAWNLQILALMKRIKSMPEGARNIIIGVSGGLDSTLALLVSHQALKRLNNKDVKIFGVSMPSKVTSKKTYDFSINLMSYLEINHLNIPINKLLSNHLNDIKHESIDVTYENSQARIRTLNLMNLANKYEGFVLGTGDLSEIALGFMTYNGDHMSMYAINSGLPKTWVRLLVDYYGRKVYKELKETLDGILSSPVTPELLENQDTEKIIGRYDINDFMLYHHLVQGASKSKMIFLIENAFKMNHKNSKIYVDRFFNRFYNSQFKRQTMPEGPKILNFSLSPRGEYRLPSDIKISK